MKIKYIALCLLLVLAACQRDEEMEIGQVIVSDECIEVSYSSVTISCDFQTNVSIQYARVYLSNTKDFASAKSYSLTAKTKNTYTATIQELTDATTYYVRYEISNPWSTKMVEEVSEFNTIPYTTPTVQTNEVIDVTYNSAIVGGTIAANGGKEITERGVVYATTQNPTTNNTKVTSGTGSGSFTCNLTDLQPNTTYYVRAYAINNKGTAYGTQVSFTTQEQSSSGNGTDGTHEYVDLGLSVKWATMNVGASKLEDYGDYFAWGETEPKDVYDWSTYKWCNGSYNTQTKYNTNSSYGTVDNKTTLDLSDDAARANWGGSWRMPTDAEMTELLTNCTWTWTTENGVNGYKVTSKSNGNSIFLPAAGSRTISGLTGAGSSGDYRSSSLYTDYPHSAWYVGFSSGNVFRSTISRTPGQSVRPVLGENKGTETTVPTVTTAAITQITESSAVAGGNVTSDGNASVTERGVVYSTNQNPTTTDTKVAGGSGVGEFTCNLTDLQSNTKYYVRAYAINEKGTAYGEEVSFTTKEVSVSDPTGTENGYGYVDLGLSVKWATCNVGASKAEEYGDYFAWGETTTKSTYDWSTYKYCNGSETTLTKYNTSSSYGTVDNKTQLELSDDAARVNWGGAWRMPTDAEWTELREQCTWTWTTQNGVYGTKVTSKTNENSIFLPAAGYRVGSSLNYAGSGCYWSSSLGTDYPYYAWSVLFNSRNVISDSNVRLHGRFVRPVLGENKGTETTVPTVTTAAITQITESFAVAGGNVTSDGNASVTERGVVYSTNQNPTTTDTKVAGGSGVGEFTCNLTDLQSNTKYYVRAYAINEKGTAYGEEVTFTTNKQIVLPTVTTSAMTQITESSAVAGGNVTADGNASVTERGVCIATVSNPTTSNTKITSGSGTGSFTCNLTNLQPNTTYYVRAYAINSKGTAYGEEVSFTTKEEMVDNPPSNLVAMPFSVSATKQVTFSPGNLQYTQSTNIWSFAENQYDYIGTDNVTGGSVSSDPTLGDSKEGTALADKLDLFGWSTSANNFGVSTSNDYNDYSGSFVDWGSNQIDNDAPNTWRTLTYEEWNYLRNSRTNADDLVGVAQVNGVNGLILLPDNWTCPAGVTFKSGFHSKCSVDYYAAHQTFTADQWSKLESAGAVFLPAAGVRYGSNVRYVQYDSEYWSATELNSVIAYCLFFVSDKAHMTNLNRHRGHSVRLVKDL